MIQIQQTLGASVCVCVCGSQESAGAFRQCKLVSFGELTLEGGLREGRGICQLNTLNA